MVMVILLFLLYAPIAVTSFSYVNNFKGNREKYIVFFIGIFLFLLSAFRDGALLPDYHTYVNYYRISIKVIEPSFILISKLVKATFDNVIFLFVIYALFGVYLKLKGILELSRLYLFSILIYVANFYLLHELVQIRASVATGLFLLSIKPLYKRDLKRFILFSTAAVCFHFSAIIIFPLWLLRKNKINVFFYGSIILFSYVLYFLHIDLVKTIISLIPIHYIQEKYLIYEKLQKEGVERTAIHVFNYVFLGKMLVFYIILFKNKLLVKNNPYSFLLLKIHAIAFVSYIVLAYKPTFATRVYEFYGVVEMITLPMLIYVIKPKIMAKAAVLLISLANILVSVFYSHLIRV